MTETDLQNYNLIRDKNECGYQKTSRGLTAVYGREAIQFLNGLLTNDIAKLEENQVMTAAFPNAQGRLLAVVRIIKSGDRFLFETEAATRDKVFQNLFRFTFAGDFFVEDLTGNYTFFQIYNAPEVLPNGAIVFQTAPTADVFIPAEDAEKFENDLKDAIEISAALAEVLRVENGIPVYGIDMDETTIVPEIAVENLISYQKGCYIGQEIIARIHFRGHVAKQLTGVIFDDANAEIKANDELKSVEEKNAGRVTSPVFSPRFGKIIALAYVRYDFLAEGTQLKTGEAAAAKRVLPFV